MKAEKWWRIKRTTNLVFIAFFAGLLHVPLSGSSAGSYVIAEQEPKGVNHANPGVVSHRKTTRKL
jgi:hypothetical protein